MLASHLLNFCFRFELERVGYWLKKNHARVVQIYKFCISYIIVIKFAIFVSNMYIEYHIFYRILYVSFINFKSCTSIYRYFIYSTWNGNLVTFKSRPAGISCSLGPQKSLFFRHALARIIKFVYLRPALGPRKLQF